MTESQEAVPLILKLTNELAAARASLRTYMDMCSDYSKRIERLEKIETAYYEQQASHTEARGMLCQERDNALRKLAEQQALVETFAWRPASERVPDHDNRVIATPSNYSYDANPTAYYWTYPDHGPHKHGHWYQTDKNGYAYEVPVTHWMSLPEAPK